MRMQQLMVKPCKLDLVRNNKQHIIIDANAKQAAGGTVLRVAAILQLLAPSELIHSTRDQESPPDVPARPSVIRTWCCNHVAATIVVPEQLLDLPCEVSLEQGRRYASLEILALWVRVHRRTL